MSQALVLKIKGLYTHPNDLSEVPEGALTRADNIVINKESIAEPRRGFDRLTYPFATPGNRANKYFAYQEKILAHYGTNTISLYDVSTGWDDYSGSFAAPDSATTPVRSAEASSNIYFTTSTGVKVLDAYDSAIGSAGMPKGLDALGSTTGASGFMSNDTQIAYRVLWGIKDTNMNLILGSPSQRAVVVNSTGGTRDVSLVITIPSGITVNHFFQVYRAPMSADASTEASDEMGLVYESNPTAGEITAKSLTITDRTPEDLRGATLYTSPSQEGIALSNDEPPLATDVAPFKGCLWYANTLSKHRLYLTIISVGATSGIAVDDVLTIAGTTYTGKSAETVASRQFKVTTAGTPSQNIADTANSLVRVINQNSTNTSVYAYYLSAEGELPGKMLIEARSLGGVAFSVIASLHGSAYNPALPTSGTTVSSTNDEFKNGLYNSKLQEPEAVPIASYRKIGSASKKIQRILPLRDSLFVLKEDGVYRVTGEYPSFNVDPIDLTTRILAPETAVVLNNQIYALSDQGVVSISDTGIQVISRSIESSILQLLGVNATVLKNKSFAVAYETERKYILFVPSNSQDTYPTQAFVYNTFTNTWTRWDLSKRCGLVNPADDKLYLGDGDSEYTNIERKTYTFRDYVDEAETYEVISVNGDVVTLFTVAGLELGDLLYQSATLNSQVIEINPLANTVTLFASTSLSVGAVTVYKAYECVVEWVPQAGGNPGLLKHFQELSMIFKNNYFPSAYIGVKSELSGAIEHTEVNGTYGGLWGLFPFGQTPWGGTQGVRVIRTLIPREKAWCDLLSIRFTHRMGYSQFQLEGVSAPFEFISERVAI